MKTILGVVGSPRRNGNTHILVSKLLEGAQTKGAATETLSLDQLQIRECDGCHACWKGTKCAKNDDMIDVYPKITEADVIIFGTPVYWYGPTALMKAFIDRFVYFNCPENRSKIRNKKAVVVVPFEEDKPGTASLLIAFFEKCFQYLEVNLIETIIVPGVTVRGEVVKKVRQIEECVELGKRICL